eukprot:3889181-Pleurochrysis_carterae.AAC.1
MLVTMRAQAGTCPDASGRTPLRESFHTAGSARAHERRTRALQSKRGEEPEREQEREREPEREQEPERERESSRDPWREEEKASAY